MITEAIKGFPEVLININIELVLNHRLSPRHIFHYWYFLRQASSADSNPLAKFESASGLQSWMLIHFSFCLLLLNFAYIPPYWFIFKLQCQSCNLRLLNQYFLLGYDRLFTVLSRQIKICQSTKDSEIFLNVAVDRTILLVCFLVFKHLDNVLLLVLLKLFNWC